MNEIRLVFGIDFARQAARRLLVVTHYLAYGLVLLPFWLAHVHSKYLLLLAFPAFLLWAGCFWALSQVTRAYAYGTKACALPAADERQAQVRDRAFARAYQILSGVFCLALLYVMLAQDFSWWLPRSGSFQGTFFGAVLFSATLQSAVVAWMEPDQLQPGEDELMQPAGASLRNL